VDGSLGKEDGWLSRGMVGKVQEYMAKKGEWVAKLVDRSQVAK
jgi:hypothetical protein